MKYLAVLKDSIREARDSKVLLVLIILSTLISLFVATLSFKPLPADTTFARLFPGDPEFFWVVATLNSHRAEKKNHGFPRHSLTLKKVKLLRGEPDSPRSDYALTVAQSRPPGSDAQEELATIRTIFREDVPLNLLDVGEIEAVPSGPDEPQTAYYRVTVHGSAGLARLWSSQINIMFGAYQMRRLQWPIGMQLYFLAALVIGIGSWVAVLTSIVITSFFIPNMLRKGTIDMLLVKPIQRWTLLVYKYIGGLVFILLCLAYAIGSIWLVLGLRTGIWGHEMLLLIPSLTFFFAILYAISTLVSVGTRNTIATIIVTITAWGLFFGIGALYDNQEYPDLHQNPFEKQPLPQAKNDTDDEWFPKTVRAAHAVTPRTSELKYLNDTIVFCAFANGKIENLQELDPRKIDWTQTLLVSAGWIVGSLVLSCLWFTYKDC